MTHWGGPSISSPRQRVAVNAEGRFLAHWDEFVEHRKEVRRRDDGLGRTKNWAGFMDISGIIGIIHSGIKCNIFKILSMSMALFNGRNGTWSLY